MGEKREEKGYRIGIYVRESRDDNQENFETLATQRDLLINYALKNIAGRIADIYEDDNVSGSVFQRQGMDKLKRDIQDGRVDMVLIKDLSRLGRNNARTLLFLDWLEENGVRVLTFDGRYDSLRDNDTVGLETWYNERYVRDISRKIRANLRYKIERGEYIGHAPFGYVKSESQRNRLCIDPEKSGVVCEIYDLYKRGYGYKQIARLMNERKIGAPASGIWNAVTIGRILSNPVYAGDTIQGISEKISFKSKKTRRLPKDRWVVTTDTHEPIIGRNEFEYVQKLIERRSAGGSRNKGQIHLLKGLLFCGSCGSPLNARNRPGRPMGYICSSYMKAGRKVCTSHHVREQEILDAVMKKVSMLLSDSNSRSEVASLLEQEALGRNNAGKEAEKLESVLESKLRQQGVLYRDRLEGRISEQLFDRTNRSLESQINQLQQDISRLTGLQAEKETGRNMIEKALSAVNQYGLTNELVRLLVDKITVYEERDNCPIVKSQDRNDCQRLINIEFLFTETKHGDGSHVSL